ncbi:tripartite tricarboxylate transporter permease [Pseudarthrobacter raffinosi]|uniref:tripartite tricarboxylate transporter permease n=1 Tax=Pseudarthrobacter raffinosi TaxID=2953651 RepID=UPI00208FDB8D|nr:tripartite tricarboxylate transporter permease [Pseudarthrobacter sp. MDT3-9]MCO4252080.1 tripartite tricarboxylate transporter permease [Pseudarthrobacter sp. MDT3-9]
MIDGLLGGFAVAFTPVNLLFVLIGVIIGMLIGVLPGLGPGPTVALLLPLTFSLEPSTAIIMLAGVYYGAMYGGTITAVLLKLPGESASVVTTFDGYQMARQGRAGAALGIAAIGSFIGGLVATCALVLIAPLLAEFGLKIGPPEYAVIAVGGLLMVSAMTQGPLIKGVISAGIGLLAATVGLDPVDAVPRFDFGVTQLYDGLNLVVVIIGVYGISEMLHGLITKNPTAATERVGKVMPTRDDFRRSAGPIARGSVLGSILGTIPGGGGDLPAVTSYALERRLSKEPRRFGRGAIEGVAGPETANNAGAVATFIPLLTLGLPPNPILAVIFGALLIQGITPGPALVSEHPEIFWGVIASMFIGNVVLLILNLPLVRVWVKVAKVPASLMSTGTMLVLLVGAFSAANDVFNIWIAIAAGIIGFLLRQAGFEAGPLVLGFVFGTILEPAVRQSLLLSRGDLSVFVTRPISGTICALMALGFAYWGFRILRRRRATSQRRKDAELSTTRGGDS